MPLYEYVCSSCRKKTEVLQSFSEKPLKVCPHCGRKALKKLLSSPAIQFKGTGWYVTDYAGKGGKKEGAAEGGKEKAAESGSDSKESKSEPKKTEKSGKKETASKKDQ